MKNQNIITNFLNGHTSGHTPLRDIQNGYYTFKGSTLSIEGDKLINYNTIIAVREGNTIKLNTNKYSTTTSKIQNQIMAQAILNGLNVIKVGELE